MRKVLQLVLVLAFASAINSEQNSLEDTEGLREITTPENDDLQEMFEPEVRFFCVVSLVSSALLPRLERQYYLLRFLITCI